MNQKSISQHHFIGLCEQGESKHSEAFLLQHLATVNFSLKKVADPSSRLGLYMSTLMNNTVIEAHLLQTALCSPALRQMMHKCWRQAEQYSTNLLPPVAPSMQHTSRDVFLREQLVIALRGGNEMKERRRFD